MRTYRDNKAALSDSENEVFVSVASLWEMAIKSQIGKLTLPVSLQAYATKLRDENQVRTLSITDVHVHAHADLGAIHRDPFDRMLVAQSLAEASCS